MKKKFMALLLAAIMVVSTLAGCSSGSGSGSGNASTSGNASASGNTDGATKAQDTADSGSGATGSNAGTEGMGTWDGEVSHIVMTYLTLGTTPADVSKVQAAVNEITVPNIGVEVEFKPIAIFDTFSQYSLWISSGEQVDLMMIIFANMNTYADQGLILPLDELLANNAPYITNAKENEGYPLYDGAYYQNEVYGVAALQYYYGAGGSFLLRKDYLDDAGITYNEGDVYTLDQLTEVFAAIKEVHPDVYPCGTITSKMTATAAPQFNVIYDSMGATPSSGVLMGLDSTTVENLYASEEYYNYLKYIKQWYDAGYIYPDAATTDSTSSELVRTGTLAGSPSLNPPVMKSDSESNQGREMVHIMLTDSYYTSRASAECAYWTVPITSKYPDAAMRFLDYTFSNHDLCNLIMWGIKDEHYTVLDEENLVIGFANGYDGTTSPYYNTLGLYGDRRYEYIWDSANNKAVNEKYTQDAMSRPSKAIGYAYDTTAMATKIANVDAVVQQYIPTLESGTENDLDALYNEFIAALETAGINDIIEDNQAQFDAWLAQQTAQ